MLIDGRGEDESISYEKLKALITEDACLLNDLVEVLVDRESSAKKINILASLAGYDTVIEHRDGHWALKVDTSHRRCR